jgi:enamine deaminase RidA (YjgF/YER057c/UK114 family)
MHMATAGHPPPEPGELESVLPTGWSRPKGYAQAVRVPSGRSLLFLAGQIGWDAKETLVGAGFTAQFEQALRNCVTIVEAAGGTAADIVRLTMYCSDRAAYMHQQRELGEAYQRVMGRHFPAMSLVEVAALLEEGALIEIEATAALPPNRSEGSG